jgi:hypothetical protein
VESIQSRDAIAEYLEKHSPVSPGKDRRITRAR